MVLNGRCKGTFCMVRVIPRKVKGGFREIFFWGGVVRILRWLLIS